MPVPIQSVQVHLEAEKSTPPPPFAAKNKVGAPPSDVVGCKSEPVKNFKKNKGPFQNLRSAPVQSSIQQPTELEACAELEAEPPSEEIAAPMVKAETLFSQISSGQSDVQKSVQRFQEQRALLKKMETFRVLRVGCYIIFFGGILLIISLTLYFVGNKWAYLGFHNASSITLTSGMVVFTTCIGTDLDLDEFLLLKPRIRLFLFMVMLVCALQEIQFPPYVAYIFMSCIAFSGVAYLPAYMKCDNFPSPTTLGSAYFFCFPFARACQDVYDSATMRCAGDGRIAGNCTGTSIRSCVFFTHGCALLGYWVRKIRTSGSCTHAFWGVLFCYCVGLGVSYLMAGIILISWPTDTEIDVYEATDRLGTGASVLVPCVFVLIVGSQKLFKYVGDRFEHDSGRIELDGAFMASLLDSISVEMGSDWWVHHGRNDTRFQEFDPQRNWTKGRVVRVSQEEFVVEVPLECEGDDLVKSEFLSASHTSQRSSVSQQSSKRSIFARIPKKATTQVTHVTIPMCSRNTPSEKLLEMAKQKLRCIDWPKITKDLIVGAICGAQVDIAGLFGLSRPVKPGEKIDYFMSNSWHDNADDKWKKLTLVAEDFHCQHERYPTLWFDKVCIDQTDLGDCLRVLPINVMACNRMLVLCGHTYPFRLWCAWELCTLFAFAQDDSVHERVQFVQLDGEPDEMESARRRLSSLKNFDVRHARCYDPNEERKLKLAIKAVGAGRFNSRIHSFAANCCLMERWD